jgi:hypothetical protein
MAKLEKKHINPVIFTWSYAKIMRECGDQAEEIAKVLGKKAEKKSKKKD